MLVVDLLIEYDMTMKEYLHTLLSGRNSCTIEKVNECIFDLQLIIYDYVKVCQMNI
jgi:hypothetical protein